jgi:hypothetical protein
MMGLGEKVSTPDNFDEFLCVKKGVLLVSSVNQM